ncbi:MAG: hypothetical protein KGJ23_15360 [Euryarchaeota archaeon]|nr:hypothetical protein [Euryarchaeota archaeon]MDE2046416.1 hypothetical protein [Thermoplasmata archaeon]
MSDVFVVWKKKSAHVFDPSEKASKLVADTLDKTYPEELPMIARFALRRLGSDTTPLDLSKSLADLNVAAGDVLVLEKSHVMDRSDEWYAGGAAIYSSIMLLALSYLLSIVWPVVPGDLSASSTRQVKISFLLWQMGPFAVGPETILLLVAVLSGAVGACIYSLWAITHHYSALKDFDLVWMGWYILRPPLAAGLAFVVYVALRAGVISSSTSVPNTSVLGIAVICFLTGMFAEHAFSKLQSIADTIFGPTPDSPSGKAPKAPS